MFRQLSSGPGKTELRIAEFLLGRIGSGMLRAATCPLSPAPRPVPHNGLLRSKE